jgi:hypothetical protein
MEQVILCKEKLSFLEIGLRNIKMSDLVLLN